MRNSEKRFLKLKLGITVLCALGISAVCIFISLKKEDVENDITYRDYDNFAANNIYIANRGRSGNIIFELSADKIIHRKIVSKLFVYQNLKEIYMSGVKINIFGAPGPLNVSERTGLPREDDSIGSRNPAGYDNPFNDMKRSLLSLGKPSTPVSEYIKGASDIDMDILIRVLFDGLIVNIHSLHGRSTVIEAARARFNISNENILLEGKVVIASSNGMRLHASRAVWSEKQGGLLFPEGYTKQNNFMKEKAFYAMNNKGELLESRDVPAVDYTDPLEEREDFFYARLLENMPAHIRLFMGRL